ncbi:hypothetical protein [Prescottella equi]|uniref:Uncharacterized protein n=1 Tax=Rhodococcus hoagii TaxID=43767 RepID=A0AAE5IP42_RHOHA|nr:hypothetical protein [Prescottella equi]AVP66708.1 hypothetical protein C7H75_01335 [Prescottella equi]ERN47677.1 hypothetical protein H849_01351 [Prescottella equi NBRC 101255 = C 7]MBM4627358.1 hypothetical protein [Prescottella equi]ORL25316.1 hypothetical protein A6I89_19565 [Prescottella equi]ORL97942.1 hypothetical protein A5N73_20095 [Prescottella equi]
MSASPNGPHRGRAHAHTAASRLAVAVTFVLLSLIPGAIAFALGRSLFAIFWLVVFTGLALGAVAAILPSSWSH